VLVIDDSGDRKDGTATAHVGKQYLGSVGKIDRGVVTVTTCWADERVHYPVHACPYTPAHHFPRGKNDPGFRTKLLIAADLAARAKAAGLVFRAVAADCAYGDQDSFRAGLHDAGLPFVLALKPRHGTWVRLHQGRHRDETEERRLQRHRHPVRRPQRHQEQLDHRPPGHRHRLTLP
jgi:SRSO17 transposase